MEHNTDRILWTVLILAIGVALYVGFRPAANGLLHQGVDKIQTVAGGINDHTSDSSNSTTDVGANLYTDTQNFSNPESWWGSKYWTKTTDTYKGLAVIQTTDPWNGLGQYIRVKKGDILTYSAYVRNISGTGTSVIHWPFNNQIDGTNYSNATLNPYDNYVTITDSWQRVSGTTVVTSDGYVRPLISRTNNNANTLQIAGIKVEKGSKATPYTP